ncbi:phosphotransferase [Pseudoclavibacter chungangensis]|uniref:Phosphotransferase n=1 Tax=Pseudoclavibacter chungangensis TaxID=587635 RepID=A0A7J5BZU0_9MICO|nr:fructosamine kinase family protein [Pseudoclavibacter chungangensis]KAB1659675.1 phosphotransferase [Pseudoclavibacter chungangensis]NYJ67514.1 fructosamine-3-kinase [Pseudoclavibacter chungangensis]
MTATVTKTATSPSDNPRGEAAGLRWLAAAQPAGGARVAAVVTVDAHHLEIERIDEGPFPVAAARAFGAALAHTHAAGAPWWGSPPEGWSGPAWVGRSRTPLVTDRATAAADWGTFYANERILAFSRRLVDDAVIDTADAQLYERLAARLERGELDAPQPRLVADARHAVARCHGDLWTGNVLADGGPTGAALIDPMAHGGHAETDLGTLSVFGYPHLDDIYAAYDEASPFADGWRERVALHELGIVIMHVHLFRGGYVDAARRLAEQYA